MSDSYEDVVVYVPPEKSPEGDMVLLKFHTKSGEVVHLRMSDYIARNLGTQLLLLSARNGY